MKHIKFPQKFFLFLSMLLLCTFGGILQAQAAVPKQVTNLRATASQSQVTLQWNRISGATGYYIYRLDPSTNTFKRYTTIKGSYNYRWSNKSLKNNVTYTYCVSAYVVSKGKTQEGAKSKQVSATPTIKAPGNTTLRLYANGNQNVTLKWTKVGSATGYEICQDDGKGNYIAIGRVTQGHYTLTVKGLKNGSSYSFKVRAYKLVDGVYGYGNFSNAVIGKPNPVPASLSSIHKFYYKAVTKTAVTAQKKDGTGSVKVKKGTSVTVVDKATTCTVKLANGTLVKIPLSNLTLSGYITSSGSYCNEATAVAFVNYKGYSSPTDYLVWINTYSQHLYIFQGSQYNWKLVRHCVCSTGKFATPSYIGMSKIYNKAYTWPFNGCFAYYPCYIQGGAIHSMLYLNGTNILWKDGNLGTPISHGCIRADKADVYFIYQKCPINTTVVTY